MTPSLTLNLFGSVNLWHDGVALAAPKSRKGLALFLYLACTGRAHTREALADLLWDATSTKQFAQGNIGSARIGVRMWEDDYC